MDARKKENSQILLLGILFFCAVLSGFIFPEISWPDRIAGGILVSVVFLTVIWIRPGAFGAGDVKLMAISGLMLGVGEKSHCIWICDSVSGIILSAGDIAQEIEERVGRLPLGPFLLCGNFAFYLLGKAFIRWYIS